MNDDIFESLRSQVMATLEKVDGRAGLPPAADAVPIERTVDGWYCLLRDGNVVHVPEGGTGADMVASDARQVAALVGSLVKRFPIATWFLPAPLAADLCSHCAGTGSVLGLPAELTQQVVCECGGIGWVPAK